jgi:UDP-GlcNAc:undecaprenyl-phosphate/decaprenyl-phosphate GlcNAc-1-phosphate transferase
VAPWIPVIVIGLPLADTAWAIVRRLVARAPIFLADRRHIHHVLLARGMSQRAAVLLLWILSAACGAIAVLFAT